jgi:hypothetical protein
LAKASGGGGIAEEAAQGLRGIGVELGGGLSEGAPRLDDPEPGVAELEERGQGVTEGWFFEGGAGRLGGELLQAGDGATEVGRGVVADEILVAGAREGLVEMVASGEGLAVGEEVDAGAVASEGDVGGVAAHDRVGEDVGAVHRGAPGPRGR